MSRPASISTTESAQSATAANDPPTPQDMSVSHALQEIIKLLKADKKPRDWLDTLGVVSTFASSVVIAAVGIFFTQAYNWSESQRRAEQEQRQNKLTEMDLMVKFMPHLTGEDQRAQILALCTISHLGSVDLAASVVEASLVDEGESESDRRFRIAALKAMNAIANTPGISTSDFDRANLATQTIAKPLVDSLPTVRVFFATDRSTDAGGKSPFGASRGRLAYGTGLVSIPRSHEAGAIEQPSWWRSAQADRHMMLRSVETEDYDEFFGRIVESLDTSKDEEVTIYVHGFNVSFDAAMLRAAQLAHDLAITSPMVLFSWPSKGVLTAYASDEAAVEAAAPDFTEFLRGLSLRTKPKRINVISHGMGCRLALKSLQGPTASAPPEEKRLINHLVLIGPDVDRDAFVRDVGPKAVQAANQVTLYVFKNDPALAAAKVLHQQPRAGDAAAGVVTIPGVETIDFELDSGVLGHSYYGDSSLFLADLRQAVRGQSASKRPSLREVDSKGQKHWVLAE